MPRITVKDSQSLFDIALQYCGTVESAFAIAQANDISITDVLMPGSFLNIPDDIVQDTDVLKYYSQNSVIPANAKMTSEMEDIAIAAEPAEDDESLRFGREYTAEFTQELGSN